MIHPSRRRYTPSGVALPALLQRLLSHGDEDEEKEETPRASPYSSRSTSTSTNDADDDAVEVDTNDKKDTTKVNSHSNRHSSSAKLQQLDLQLQETVAALGRVQQQIVVGEECYVEEAGPQNNLFKGWDSGFIDAPVLGGSQPISSSQSAGPTSRRLAADHRWFSGSYYSNNNNKKKHPPSSLIPSATATATVVGLGNSTTLQRLIQSGQGLTVWSLSEQAKQKLRLKRSIQDQQSGEPHNRKRPRVVPDEVDPSNTYIRNQKNNQNQNAEQAADENQEQEPEHPDTLAATAAAAASTGTDTAVVAGRRDNASTKRKQSASPAPPRRTMRSNKQK